MGSSKTAEEVRAEYVEAMGLELGGCFYSLYHELVLVHAKWLEYRELYAHSSERLDLLNRTSGFFFKIVQDGLWDDVLLHIARLTDPVQTAGNENLTVQILPSLVADEEIQEEASTLIEHCIEKSAFAREHRNKRLAHRDLLLASDETAVPLSGVSRAHIEDMLASLRELMNKLDHHYRDTTVMYERFVAQTGARSLIGSLMSAEEYKVENVAN